MYKKTIITQIFKIKNDKYYVIMLLDSPKKIRKYIEKGVNFRL